MLITGFIMASIVFAVAVFAPVFLTHQATALSSDSNAGSMPGHLLGTDSLGHDMLARTLVATRLTVLTSLTATAVAASIGITLGIGVWLLPRRLREAGLRGIEFVVTYPTLLVAIMIAAILGKGVMTVIIAIGVANIAGFARLTANLAASLAYRDFVVTARLIGVPPLRLSLRHILPNMAEPTLIVIAQSFAGALVEISALSFVGLGSQNPHFDFGTLLNDALRRIVVNPVLVIGPAFALFFTSLMALLIGDGLAAAADPRSTNVRARLEYSSDTDPDAPHSTIKASGDPLLIAENITVNISEKDRMLMKGVSFTIHRGEILGIVGESGSGKSLTASVVANLVPEGLLATAHQLRLGSTDLLGKISNKELAKRISLIYQDPGTSLNPALTLGSQFSDVLTQPLGMSRKDAKSRLVDAFRAVWLSNPNKRLQQHPHELSGGMQQRAMIASAMSTHPELLIADEPTTALDVTVQREVLSLIKQMNRESDTAVLFISHDIAVIKRLCDRVIVMRHGQIVERIDNIDDLTVDRVTHPYTRQLLAATPSVHTANNTTSKESRQ
jgi:ABC-type dipeptide/oligopeptide/nickel transport system ATPase component/ABC-type dipeptide/oligopeptide/nickel transport system permease subunit